MHTPAQSLNELNFDRSEAVQIAPEKVSTFERILETVLGSNIYMTLTRPDLATRPFRQDSRYLPSPLISMEFIGGEARASNLCSVGYDPRGMSIAHSLGVPVIPPLAEWLENNQSKGLVFLTPSGESWESEDQRKTMEALRRRGTKITVVRSLHNVSDERPIWVTRPNRSFKTTGKKGKANRPALERSFFGAFEMREDRTCLLGVNSLPLTLVQNVDQLDQLFSQGYIVKRIVDAGNGLIRCDPEDLLRRVQPESVYQSRRRVAEIFSTGSQAEYMAQEMVKIRRPRIAGNTRREHWMLYFLPGVTGFKLIGGFGFSVTDGPVALKAQTLVRPLLVG